MSHDSSTELRSSSENFNPLPRSFFAPTADLVAPGLLGHWLVRRTPDGLRGGPIVEVEAYLADDPACHAFGGETARNRAMFGEPGMAYVYFIYGCHFCVNAVCQPHGVGEAVLIRAIEPVLGSAWMLQRRPVKHPRDLTNGPAKLCQALQIDRDLDGVDLCDTASPLFISENEQLDEFLAQAGPMVETTRIGITKAAHAPLRSYLEGSRCVSKRVAR